jgi:hypothetical protein
MQIQREFPAYLSATKIKKQMLEWEKISRNQNFIEKIVEPVGNLVISYVLPTESAIESSNVTKSFAAENLLRHYYHGHQTLGTNTVDAAVAKGSRAVHVRSRNNAGPAQRTLALYEQYISEQRQLDPHFLEFSLKRQQIHDRGLPSTLLGMLKEDLLARGKSLNLKGDLAAVIYVIQNKCGINVMNLSTINQEIAAENSKKAPDAKNTASFWRNPLGYFSESSGQEVFAAKASDAEFEIEYTSFEPVL